MESIELRQVTPDAFGGRELSGSEVWQTERTFGRGEVCLVEAVSGAGKSSLCGYLYGYRKDYRGTIAFDGKDIRKWGRGEWRECRNNRLSMLFQDLRLFPELTASENIKLKNRLTHYKSKEWIRTAFERVGIADKWESPAGKLSFGQQQRVALIRALCQPFDFILLDEPVSHLDAANSRVVGELLSEEVRQRGAGLILTSIGLHPLLKYDKTLRL
ncbi:MAG: ATP-binding cassette domain-containing protein [Culturomica sp.]|jgi:ABC-type lipoprotein export system ATPase subunit|nr:ATP-binding cassette domain-containing protein [Culturomica sp.]